MANAQTSLTKFLRLSEVTEIISASSSSGWAEVDQWAAGRITDSRKAGM